MCKTKIIKLYICHDCHNRIEENEHFTNYRNTILCDRCFISNLDKIDISTFTSRDILVGSSNQDLI